MSNKYTIEDDEYDFGTALVVREVFSNTAKYAREYGAERTVTLTQIGVFYEVYGIRNINDPMSYYGSNIEKFMAVSFLEIGEKHTKIKRKSDGQICEVVMAGFKIEYLQKFLNRLTAAQLTTVVFSQFPENGAFVRKLTGIYSPGTDMTPTVNTITNNTVCIWFEMIGYNIHIGIASIDIFTGCTTMYEYSEIYENTPATFDTLEKFVSVLQPSEAIVISAMSNTETTGAIAFSGLTKSQLHVVFVSESQKAKNCEKQTYQHELLRKFYDEDVNLFEFDSHLIATQAFVYLLDFMNDHNPALIRRISRPQFENIGDKLILANHSLQQLNIINSNSSEIGRFSCVEKMLNICKTPMGARLFKYQLLNPTSDVNWLQAEYNKIDIIRTSSPENHNAVIGFLRTIRDMFKFARDIIMGRVEPRGLKSIYTQIESVKHLTKLVDPNVVMFNSAAINADADEILAKINQMFDVDVCATTKCTDSSDFILIRRGINAKIDEHVYDQNHKRSFNRITMCQQWLNAIIKSNDPKLNAKSAEINYVKIHTTKTMQISLMITKVRSKLLDAALKTVSTCPIFDDGFEFDHTCLAFDPSSDSSYQITSPQIEILSKNITKLDNELSVYLQKVYDSCITKLEPFCNHLKRLGKFVAHVDTIYAKALISIRHNYFRPTLIATEDGSSCVSAKNLRHALYECTQSTEIYVTNDIELNCSGILLYGTNAVGKTSLMRSLGVAIIMAQAGMFVAASTFELCPYKQIFTRIMSSDKPELGLSTFDVEVLELINIFDKSSNTSIVLGDELCSGTSTQDATSIFTAGVCTLSARKCSFLFATHLHEIVNYYQITDLVKAGSLHIKHMTCFFDRERGKMVYGRKLCNGSGDAAYGLEHCKSRNMQASILELANKIRMENHPETASILDLRTSRYNSKKIVGNCEKCKVALGTEVHHLHHQSQADENGYITLANGQTFHKNHPANLMTVCEACHNSFHYSAPAPPQRQNITINIHTATHSSAI